MAWSELFVPFTGARPQLPVQPESIQTWQLPALPRPWAGSAPGPGPNKEPAPLISVLVGPDDPDGAPLDDACGDGEDTGVLPVELPPWFLPSRNPATSASAIKRMTPITTSETTRRRWPLAGGAGVAIPSGLPRARLGCGGA